MSDNIDINEGNKDELSTKDFICPKDESTREDYVYNIKDNQNIVEKPNMQSENNFINQIVDLNIADCVDKEDDTNTDHVDLKIVSNTEDYVDIEEYTNIEDILNTEDDLNIEDLSDSLYNKFCMNLLYKENEQNTDDKIPITKEILVQKDKVNRQYSTSTKHDMSPNDIKYTLPTYKLDAEDDLNLENDSNLIVDPNSEEDSNSEHDSNRENVTCTKAIDNSVPPKNYLDIENSVNTKHIPNLDKEESNEDEIVRQQDSLKDNIFDTNNPIVHDLLCPDIYIDENEYSKSTIRNDSVKLYSIDGISYIDKKSPPLKDWMQFEVYAEDMENNSLTALDTESDGNCYSSSDSDSSENEDIPSSDVEFDVTLQKVSRGYIINEQIFLTDQQWNTMILEKLETYHCVVCNLMCDLETHLNTSYHNVNINNHKPLEKYELHIIRKIRNFYHCAMCNKIIEDPPQKHCNTEPHGDNMRYAINKVFDIEYVQSKRSVSGSKKECYHFDAEALNNYMGMNDDQETCDEGHEGDEDQKTPSAYPSYASIAKTPKGPELPEYIMKDLGDKRVKVKYDSWHMIITIDNKLYCIVCKSYFKTRAQHCSDVEHLRNLNRCAIVEKYIGYYIRMVDDKFYHCGHCNNLQYINDMDIHIETQHLNRNEPNTRTDTHTTITHNKEVKNKKEFEVKNENVEVKHENSFENKSDKHENSAAPNINVYITLHIFNRRFLVPNLSFHMIKPFDYYCGFCNMRFTETTISYHMMYDQHHILLLRSTAFLNLFSIHLIRMMKDSYHCAICNMVIQYQSIYIHISDVAHCLNLEIAIGVRPPPMLPPIPNDPSNPYHHQFNEALVKEETSTANVTSNTNEVTPKKTSAGEKMTNAGEKMTNASEKMTNASDETADTSEKTTKEAHKMADIIKHAAKLTENTNEMEETKEAIEKATKMTEKMTKAKGKITNKACLLDDEANLLNESTTTEEDTFDTEECILAKINNNVLKITNSAYNTLTPMGSGSKYCFVCTTEVIFSELMKHVNSRSHIEALEGCKFLSNVKYDGNLLRQSYLLYHCAVCNVLFLREDLDDHLFWLTHMDELTRAQNNAKNLKTADITQINVFTTEEIVYLNQMKPKLKIHLDVEIVYEEENEKNEGLPRSKVVFFKKHVFKIDWRIWHGLVKHAEDTFSCNMCNRLIPSVDLNDHLKSDEHLEKLDKPFIALDNGLIRELTSSSYLCIICCSELTSMNAVQSHVLSKNHKFKWNRLIEESREVVSYEGCEEYDGVIM